MLRTAIVSLLTCTLTQATSAATFHYECKSDLVSGYHFDEATRAWTPIQFRSDRTYVIRQLTEKERESQFLYPKNSTWGVFEPGDKIQTFSCPEPDNKDSDRRMTCGGIGHNLVFGRTSLRYQRYYVGGYVAGVDNNDDTPFIEIGRCRFVNE